MKGPPITRFPSAILLRCWQQVSMSRLIDSIARDAGQSVGRSFGRISRDGKLTSMHCHVVVHDLMMSIGCLRDVSWLRQFLAGGDTLLDEVLGRAFRLDLQTHSAVE